MKIRMLVLALALMVGYVAAFAPLSSAARGSQIEAGKKGPYRSYAKAKDVAYEMQKKGYKCSIAKQGGYYYVYYR